MISYWPFAAGFVLGYTVGYLFGRARRPLTRLDKVALSLYRSEKEKRAP